VTVLSQVAIPDQHHHNIATWQTLYLEGLVALTSSAGSSPVSGTVKSLANAGLFAFPER
jgi:hypothetical protein